MDVIVIRDLAVGHDDDSVVLGFAALPVAVGEDGAGIRGCDEGCRIDVSGDCAGIRIRYFDGKGSGGGANGCDGTRCRAGGSRNEVDFTKGGVNFLVREDAEGVKVTSNCACKESRILSKLVLSFHGISEMTYLAVP